MYVKNVMNDMLYHMYIDSKSVYGIPRGFGYRLRMPYNYKISVNVTSILQALYIYYVCSYIQYT